MSTKTFRGTTLHECYLKVKDDMGSDAIILQSRTVKSILGRFGKMQHEVVATLDDARAEQMARPAMKASGGNSGRGVYGYSQGSGTSDGGRGGERDGRQPAKSSKLQLTDLGPQRAIEIAEMRAAEIHGSSSRKIEVRGLDGIEAPGRPIETRDELPGPLLRRGIAESRAAFSAVSQQNRTASDSQHHIDDERLERLESQVSSLTATIHKLSEAAMARGKGKMPPITVTAAQQALAPAAASTPLVSEPAYPLLRKRLIESGMVEPLARRLVDQLAAGISDGDAAESLRTAIAGRVLVAAKLEPITGKTLCAAFVGPTGVGKTTTLAKLAAQLTLQDHHKVAIITMDTQRVAASRQIETFGEILRIPVKIAYDSDELEQHYHEFEHQGYDFVLIDTPGRSPNDAIAIGEMARSLKRLPIAKTYLVVPAPISGTNHDYITGRFYSLLTPDAVILTKCDESADSSHFAHLLTAQAKFSVPIAYTTAGPRVPDDLTFADPHLMAERLLAA